VPDAPPDPGLRRHFGLAHATALNVIQVVGAGIFLTVPLIVAQLPGPYALLGWLGAGALILLDGLVWSELAATMPGSGGSYVYLRECYGPHRWGRLMAFLFVWQFLISAPLEVGSGLVAISQFSTGLSRDFDGFNRDHTWEQTLWEEQKVSVAFPPQALLDCRDRDPGGQGRKVTVAFGPSRLLGAAVGLLVISLVYRRVEGLGRLALGFGVVVLAVIAWLLLDGALRFSPAVAFDWSGRAAARPPDFPGRLGAAMVLAMYAYLGYYNVCYVGDEVRDPGRTIPRAVLLSAALVVVLFVALHLAMVGVVSWRDMPTQQADLDNYNLPAEVLRHGRDRAVGDVLASVLAAVLIASCTASAFAALVGYSRVPFGAARQRYFFAAFGAVHPRHQIPHRALLLMGGLTLFWGFFDLGTVINALIATRILEQFVAQIVGLVLLRRRQPDRPRPFRVWLYPLPCGLALVGWLFLYGSVGLFAIGVGLTTLLTGGAAFLLWSRQSGGWPFGPGTPGQARG
jgi:amino acid transporter